MKIHFAIKLKYFKIMIRIFFCIVVTMACVIIISVMSIISHCEDYFQVFSPYQSGDQAVEVLSF